MKNNNLEMAWQEPRDGRENSHRGPERPRNDGSAPDLDQLLKKFGGIFGGGKKGMRGQGQAPQGFGKYVAIGAVLLFGGWLATGFYTVDAGQKGVELFLGKYHATKNPGLTWRFPSPIGEHRIIDIQRRFSQKIGIMDKGGRRSAMLTKDENIVDVRVEVQYQIDNDEPHKYWFTSVNPDETLKEVVDSATRERVGQTLLDDILTDGREKLMQEVKELAQNIIDNYEIGLVITNVNLEDAQAPAAVQDAFSDAIRAREDEQSRINQAKAYQSKVEEEAQGEAEREIRQAEAYRESKIAQARGEAERFNQLFAAYQISPEITRERLYLETIERVFEDTNKIIMGQQGGNNNLMMLPLEKMLDQQIKKSSSESEKAERSQKNESAVKVEAEPNNERTPVVVQPQVKQEPEPRIRGRYYR